MNIRYATVAFFLLGLQGCFDDPGFPEDSRIKGPIDIGVDWKEVVPEQPLAVNHEGLQRLHLVVDSEDYTPNHRFSDQLGNESEHFFDLRSPSGELVVPEVILVAENGEQVVLGARSNTYLYEGGVTVGMATVPERVEDMSPPFPEDIERFQSLRIRSSVPFTAESIWWMVDQHPDMHQ